MATAQTILKSILHRSNEYLYLIPYIFNNTKTSFAMKPMLCISVAAMLAIALGGCEKKTEPPSLPPFSDYFIRSYADPPTQEEVEANVYSSVTGDEPQIPLNQIKLVFSYKNSVDIPQDYCLRNYPATPEEKRGIVVFDSLARAHHDTEYKRRGEVFCSCLFVRTDRIDVFSDTDYDAAHPAGTPLNDIVDIRFSSGEDYLQSGYTKGKYLGKTTRLPIRYNSFYKTYDVSRSVIDLQESLEEFNRIKRKLIAFNFAFEFRSDPSHTAEHNFTIVYRNEQGLTLSGQVGPVLLKGTE